MNSDEQAPTPTDPAATPQALALLRRLHALSGRATLFGHQDDTAYGTTWRFEPGRSDVLEATGRYPSVLGLDVGHLETGAAENIDGVPFDLIRTLAQEACARGALVTLSWHSVNPVTGGGYGRNTSPAAIRSVLPGGERHGTYLGWLARLAEFLRSLTDADGNPVPLVFRPYHEHSGDWFWWCTGGGLNAEDDFVALWRFTVEHLTRTEELHSLLYAISPDRSRLDIADLERSYLRGYPGDAYVDVLGVDDYWDVWHPANPVPRQRQFEEYVTTLSTVGRLARERGKVAALTESGNVPTDDPWTGYLLKALLADEDTRRIAWTLVWRNPFGEESGGTPQPGTPAAADLAAFADHPAVLFAPDLPGPAA